MTKTIRIGNAQAFWGDRSSAAAELLSQEPNLDYLTMDYLAEVSMSILAQQRVRNGEFGYAQDFIQVVRSLSDYWASGGRCRLIVNAGGLNPMGCAQACQQALQHSGCRALKIGVVSGDDVLELLKRDAADDNFKNLDDGRSLSDVRDRLITANAYLGCAGMVAALRLDADIVITGRVADPSMVLAACVHAFDWRLDDWDMLAAGTVAGHLLECGSQVTGGISTDWLSVPDPAHIGFPIVEIDDEGRCFVTKSTAAGGVVNEATVKEQLLYEIGDPANYLSPDVSVSFLDLYVEQVAENRVEVLGAEGSPRPETLKVSATYADGFRAAGTLTIIGEKAVAKAQRCAQIVTQRLAEAGWQYGDVVVETLGTMSGIDVPQAGLESPELCEVVLRIAVESQDRDAVDAFTREMIPLVTAGPQGITGYAEGRPRVHSVYRYWPCLIDAHRPTAQVQFLQSQDTLSCRDRAAAWPPQSVRKFAIQEPPLSSSSAVPNSVRPRRLIDVAYGRSGDKGTGANVGILVRDIDDYETLARWLTREKVMEYFAALQLSDVVRFELPNLGALNFILRGALRRGGRTDAQGKALASALLLMPLNEDWHST